MLHSKKLAIVALAVLMSSGGTAFAKGCLTGAAVGGVAGHVAGKHTVVGAGIGCLVGRHRANKKDKEQATARNSAPPIAAPAPAPTK